jgi:hypothetical protein
MNEKNSIFQDRNQRSKKIKERKQAYDPPNQHSTKMENVQQTQPKSFPRSFKSRKQPNQPSMGRWLDRLQTAHTMTLLLGDDWCMDSRHCTQNVCMQGRIFGMRLSRS